MFWWAIKGGNKGTNSPAKWRRPVAAWRQTWSPVLAATSTWSSAWAAAGGLVQWSRPASDPSQTALDLHHSTGRVPAGTGLAGLGKPGRGHTAQDCASQGLVIAEAADGRWLYQMEAQHPGVDCRWHRTQGHQPSGPGRTCRATAPPRAAGAWLAGPAMGLCRVYGCAQAC